MLKFREAVAKLLEGPGGEDGYMRSCAYRTGGKEERRQGAARTRVVEDAQYLNSAPAPLCGVRGSHLESIKKTKS
jgi:hypothetical protein